MILATSDMDVKPIVKQKVSKCYYFFIIEDWSRGLKSYFALYIYMNEWLIILKTITKLKIAMYLVLKVSMKGAITTLFS